MTAVLDHLTAAGWGPCASRCRHHDDTCSAIVDANTEMGEALTTTRAEIEQLKQDRDAAPRHALLEVADRLDGEMLPTQDECVKFVRDVAEEYPHSRYMRKPEWVTENSELAAEVERHGDSCPTCGHEWHWHGEKSGCLRPLTAGTENVCTCCTPNPRLAEVNA